MVGTLLSQCMQHQPDPAPSVHNYKQNKLLKTISAVWTINPTSRFDNKQKLSPEWTSWLQTAQHSNVTKAGGGVRWAGTEELRPSTQPCPELRPHRPPESKALQLLQSLSLHPRRALLWSCSWPVPARGQQGSTGTSSTARLCAATQHRPREEDAL